MSNTIRILRGPERVRLRPAVIFGDDGIEGAKHAVGMMLCIMAAECIDGYSHSLKVTIFKDHSIEINNDGRGLFFGEPHKTDDSIWKDMFCEIFAGSKFEDSNNRRFSIFAPPDTMPKREYSIEEYDDLYLCAVQFASEYMDVISVRDNFKHVLHFEKGINIGGLKKDACDQTSETWIRFKLDKEVFSDIAIPHMFFQNQLEALAMLNPGITCSLQIEEDNSTQVFSFPKGIADYMENHKCEGHSAPVFINIIEGIGQERYNRPAYKASVEVGISFEANNGYIKCYHNQRELTFGGSHIRAILPKICDCFLCQTDVSPSLEQLLQHLQLVVTSYSSVTTYWENGTRRSICNTVIKDMTEDTLDDRFSDFLTANSTLIKQIFAT